jgi:hypothetical protein
MVISYGLDLLKTDENDVLSLITGFYKSKEFVCQLKNYTVLKKYFISGVLLRIWELLG